ncbi:5-methylcytosine restriction system specificity protein McrC [Flavobacterium poyangense]|uniref:5-methylcytosine restriction system specificity protein McrC n=1 Tax=Flavobacterium poyangense TaxID=2204302 RepID=UPI0014200E24|nr:restriction endonuclease [Flavobacterium sp. JXAS1]
MGIRLSEHKSILIPLEETINDNINHEKLALLETVQSKLFNKTNHCFIITQTEVALKIQADYCIGLDWLGKTGRSLYVEPKINSSSAQLFNLKTGSKFEENEVKESLKNNTETTFELDYLKMLFQVNYIPESNSELKDLIKIDWNAKHIEIEQQKDKLTPFLIVRFLQTLKAIVRKGLKRNYYKVQKNLSNRVKGKILISQHIKQNSFKNRFTNTYCEYQHFGEDHVENRFLKKALQFVSAYVENNKVLFGNIFTDLQHSINYCRPAFELVSEDVNEYELKHRKHNPFYQDYKEALKIGSYILKRFAYNITQTSALKITTPPFWIDMPRLFELYVYSKMVEANPVDKKNIHYQFSTYGNALDILVSKSNNHMIIDAKYKLHYQTGHLHDDIRQVAGYARLKKVREQLNVTDDKNIDCLIIYPDMENGISVLTLENIIQFRQEIKSYYKVFKLGVKLPWI